MKEFWQMTPPFPHTLVPKVCEDLSAKGYTVRSIIVVGVAKVGSIMTQQQQVPAVVVYASIQAVERPPLPEIVL